MGGAARSNIKSPASTRNFSVSAGDVLFSVVRNLRYRPLQHGLARSLCGDIRSLGATVRRSEADGGHTRRLHMECANGGAFGLRWPLSRRALGDRYRTHTALCGFPVSQEY